METHGNPREPQGMRTQGPSRVNRKGKLGLGAYVLSSGERAVLSTGELVWFAVRKPPTLLIPW